MTTPDLTRDPLANPDPVCPAVCPECVPKGVPGRRESCVSLVLSPYGRDTHSEPPAACPAVCPESGSETPPSTPTLVRLMDGAR
jgi:hypothetical protein